MNRSIQFLSIVALGIAIAGCSQAAGSIGDAPISAPTAAASPTPSESAAPPASPVPSANPTPTPALATPSPTEHAVDPAAVFAANGIGPYVVGAEMSEMQSPGLIANIGSSFHCDDSWQYAEATGRYADAVALMFHEGRVTDISTDSTEFVTPSGARVGMPLTELQRIYGRRGTLITGASANQAFSVHVPDGLGIVFFLDDTNTTVRSMSAGEVEWLDIAAVVGEGC